MKLLEINSVCGIRSTGRIVTDIALEYQRKGWEVKIAYGRADVPEKFSEVAVRIGNDFNVKLNALSCRIFDNDGFTAKTQTRAFLKWAEEYDPDELWIHNLHGYYINLELLFDWIKKRPKMKVKWTLHDCWAFTGHCSHFSYEKCYKWKDLCYKCPLKKEYPSSFLVDNSKNNFQRKKRFFTGIKNLTIITPSYWLRDLVKQSFLKEYEVEVKHNTVDKEIFKETPSDFRQRYGIEDKKIILGVASAWGTKKGLFDFYKLERRLSEKYKIVLVGLSEKQINEAPENIIKIERTNSQKELAEIYSASDIFVNLTYEDTYPTVNLEAQACGTVCITYRTGGSVESVQTENCIEQGDLEALCKRIDEITGE